MNATFKTPYIKNGETKNVRWRVVNGNVVPKI